VFRRSEPRSAPNVSALLLANGVEHPCEILDLSERGARLRMPGELATDCFDLVVSNAVPARRARVRWRRGNEVGVQFGPRESGDLISDVHLAAADPPHASVSLQRLVGEGRSVLVGVIGAFGPACTEVHTRAAELQRSGFSRLICVAPNDPWTVKAWASWVDPERRITFLCDGHLEFGRWPGATYTTSKRRHLGPRPRSYLALVRSGTIERLTFDSVAASLMFDEAREQEADRLSALQASLGASLAA
jgi:2-Cys peroxiredoxin 5